MSLEQWNDAKAKHTLSRFSLREAWMSPEEFKQRRDAENARVKGTRFYLKAKTPEGKEYEYGFIGTGDADRDRNVMIALGITGLLSVQYDWNEEQAKREVPGDDQA